MNGFRKELFNKIIGLNGHIIVSKIARRVRLRMRNRRLILYRYGFIRAHQGMGRVATKSSNSRTTSSANQFRVSG